MKHSRQETFFWLEAASLLDRVAVPSLVSNEDTKQVLDFTQVRQSLDLATEILVCLATRRISIDELATGANEKSEMRFGSLRVDVKKYALAHIGATGNTADRVVAYALQRAIIQDADVLRAKRKRMRRPVADIERIGIVPRFLVDYWCGERGVYGQVRQPGIFFMPPLCFFTNKALSAFCEIRLNIKTDDDAVRQWIHRLRLERPRLSSSPKIKDVRLLKDELRFCQ